jgi:hypothetical protein
LPGDGLHVQQDALVTEGDCKADVARSVVHDLVVWHGISVTYLWGPLCGGREGGVFVGGDAFE